jgi:carotene biosynthesis associated membrane protein
MLLQERHDLVAVWLHLPGPVGCAAKVPYGRQDVEGLAAGRIQRGIGQCRHMEVQGEILCERLLVEDIFQQLPVSRSEDDVVVGKLGIAAFAVEAVGPEVDHEERHRITHAGKALVGVFTPEAARQKTLVSGRDIPVTDHDVRPQLGTVGQSHAGRASALRQDLVGLGIEHQRPTQLPEQPYKPIHDRTRPSHGEPDAPFAFGVVSIGWRKTSIFAVVSYVLSLASELIGTGTGWPFGNYAYTDFLGYKVLDHVPYTIPLSWFYMGFASYLLGSVLADRLVSQRHTLWSLMLGTWFLTVWDLVLDPAMAHESLRVQFWVWDETGPYFGMPVKNFIGWSVTGLLFMAISRILWREDVKPQAVPMLFPLAVYTANVVFAMVLSAGVDLWMPILLAAVLGLIPAIVVAHRSLEVVPQHPRLARDA